MLKKLLLIIAAIVFVYNCKCATVSYGDRVVIYRDDGSCFNFLHVKYYENKNAVVVNDNPKYNSEENDGCWWVLTNPDNIDDASKIKYGNKVLLSVVLENKKFYMHMSPKKTKIKKRKNNKKKYTIDSYYQIEGSFEQDILDPDVKTLGIFIIKNPLRMESTNLINNTNPIILKPLSLDDKTLFLESRITIGKNPANWYIKTRRDTK